MNDKVEAYRKRLRDQHRLRGMEWVEEEDRVEQWRRGARKLIVCCDGTGNQTGLKVSNVLRTQRIVERSPTQVLHYDFGVGTPERPDAWRKLSQDVATGLGLATGYGLDRKVINAYKFLVEKYEKGDRIFLFGFSRGAYAVRILAAMIHRIGLLPPDMKHRAGSALAAFEQSSSARTSYDSAELFARQLHSRRDGVDIEFVGVWDTVASLIMPRPERFYLPSLTQFEFTRRNPSVKIFRHAIAIDERRRMFRLDPWEEPQNSFSLEQKATYNRAIGQWLPPGQQDIRQVWFAGVHADVGGGYEENIGGLSKFPLIWMIEEAMKAGLTIDRDLYHRLAWGIALKDKVYVKPTFAEPQDSMLRGWRVLEFLPKASKYKEWPERRSLLGHYIPNAEPRQIPEGSFIHESVLRCMDAVPEYRPTNLPKSYRIFPMSHPPDFNQSAM